MGESELAEAYLEQTERQLPEASLRYPIGRSPVQEALQ